MHHLKLSMRLRQPLAETSHRSLNSPSTLPAPDETHLPADIPSYLSSQGTLADRQEGYISSESGSSHQYLASSLSGYYLQHKDMNGTASPQHSPLETSDWAFSPSPRRHWKPESRTSTSI